MTMQGAWWQLTIRLEVEEYEKLHSLAVRAGKDLSEFVREILLNFIKGNSTASNVERKSSK